MNGKVVEPVSISAEIIRPMVEEMRGALLAAHPATPRGKDVVSADCVRRWFDILAPYFREKEKNDGDDG